MKVKLIILVFVICGCLGQTPLEDWLNEPMINFPQDFKFQFTIEYEYDIIVTVYVVRHLSLIPFLQK
jgi:hypothetical protein